MVEVGVGVGGRMGNRRWANAEFCAGEATDERGSLLWAVMLNDWHAHTHTHTHTPHSGSCVCVCVCVSICTSCLLLNGMRMMCVGASQLVG